MGTSITLPIQNLKAADLLNVCCGIQKECCPSFIAGGCANIVPVQDFCEVPRHDLGAFMEITVFPASRGSTGRKKEESTHFQPITCYGWFLPDAIPSWQSLKPKQFLRHPFDLTKRETFEGAMPWSSVIKSVRGTQ